MPMTRATRATLLALLVSAALLPAGARAQTPVPTTTTKPYEGVFGASQRSDAGVNQAGLLVSVYEERGQLREGMSSGEAIPSGDRILDGVFAEFSFDRRQPRHTISFAAGGHFRAYRDPKDAPPADWRFDFAVSGTPGHSGRTTVRFGQSVNYSSYLTVPAYPAGDAGSDLLDPAPVGVTQRDDGLERHDVRYYRTSLGLEHQLSQRWIGSLSAAFGYSDIGVVGGDERDVRAGGWLGRRMTRYLTFRVGYAFRTGDLATSSPDARRFTTHDIDLSFDYRKPLFRSQKTTFAFGVGSSRLSGAGDPEKFRMVGYATLRRDLPKRWFAELDYQRGFRLAPVFTDVWFSDTVTGRLGGLLGRRVEVSATGGYALGKVGAENARFDSWQATGRLRLALARFLAVDGDWVYYTHTFDENVPLLVDLARRHDRQAWRVSLTVWLPFTR